MPHDPVAETHLLRIAEALRAHAVDGSQLNYDRLSTACNAYQRYLRTRQLLEGSKPVRRARRVSLPEADVSDDEDETTESSAMTDTETTEEARKVATFEKEKMECDRFIEEFGGIYDSRGTRHRVIIYYEDMRRIAELCRYFRDTAIGESIQVTDEET